MQEIKKDRLTIRTLTVVENDAAHNLLVSARASINALSQCRDAGEVRRRVNSALEDMAQVQAMLEPLVRAAEKAQEE